MAYTLERDIVLLQSLFQNEIAQTNAYIRVPGGIRAHDENFRTVQNLQALNL
jgi:hypothetical protein